MPGLEGSDKARHTKPKMSSVQGGQALSQWADLVIGCFQPLRRGVTDEEKEAVRSGYAGVETIVEPHTAALSVLKNREGKNTGALTLYWVRNNIFTPRPLTETILPKLLARTEYEIDVRKHESNDWASEQSTGIEEADASDIMVQQQAVTSGNAARAAREKEEKAAKKKADREKREERDRLAARILTLATRADLKAQAQERAESERLAAMDADDEPLTLSVA